MIDAFAVAPARGGFLKPLAHRVANQHGKDEALPNKSIKWTLLLILVASSQISQNLVSVHIAFIPALISPPFGVMNKLKMDRRAAACVLACMTNSNCLLLPTGFGAVYLK
jgi:predicted histidine transporter YuiF (NhaC family)